MSTRDDTFMKTCFMHGQQCSFRDKLIINQKRVFIAMPFRGTENVFFAIKDAITKSNYQFERADLDHSNIMIPCKVCQKIQSSQFVVGDISSRNPNVLFELGLAFAIGRTVKLVTDEKEGAPTDLLGLEYTPYDSSNLEGLSAKLQQWFKEVKTERYQSDDYLLGHVLRIKKMTLVLNNFNTNGDVTTKYDIIVQKIAITDTIEEFFSMPYHDSISVDVPEDYFDLQAVDQDGKALDVRYIIFSSRLKRFGVIFTDLAVETKKLFSVTMKEKRLFDQEEDHDWYDINIMYPTELLAVEIKFNPKWKIGKVWVSYGESLSKVKEITKLEHTDSTIYVELTRPKVGLIYMIRWKWDSMSSSG